MLDFDTLENDYNKLVTLRGYKTGGGKMYQSCVLEFFSFLKEQGYTTCIFNGDDMNAYFKYLISRPNKLFPGTLSDTSINHHLFALKILFNYLLDTGRRDSLPVLPSYIRGQKEPMPILSVDEIKLMYKHCESELETALLSTAYGCGLRRSEIASLKLTDIDLRSANLIVRSGKGSKRREVPLSDKVVEDFKVYIHGERIQSQKFTPFLFISPQYGTALSGNILNKIIKNIAKRTYDIQDKKVTLHTLRRSIATHLAENGAGIHFIKDFLGHSEIDTAQLYAIRRNRQTRIT